MKKTLLLIGAICCSAFSFGQSGGEEAAWMAFMTPGKQHEMLAKDNGRWSEDISIFMQPGAPPMTAKSVCNNEMVLGGRYQRSVHKGEMMGMPFEGESTVGYDNGRKIWFSTWIDNMGTGVMYGEGNYDEAKKALVFTGKMTDPNSGKQMDYKQVMTMIDEDHQKMELFAIVDGAEFKSMEILFTRAK